MSTKNISLNVKGMEKVDICEQYFDCAPAKDMKLKFEISRLFAYFCKLNLQYQLLFLKL